MPQEHPTITITPVPPVNAATPPAPAAATPAAAPAEADPAKAAAKPEETPKKEEKAPEAPKETPRNRFAVVAKEEQKLRAKQEEIAAREARVKEMEEVQELVKKGDRLAVLQKLGLTYDDITKDILANDPKDQKLSEMEKQLKALNDEREAERAKKEEEESKQKYEKAVQGAMDAIQKHVDENLETYELIKQSGSFDAVLDVIRVHHQRTNETMPIDEACKLVEAFLEQQGQTLLKAKKAAKWLGGGEAKPAPTINEKDAKPVAGPSGKSLSQEERFQRAVARLN